VPVHGCTMSRVSYEVDCGGQHEALIDPEYTRQGTRLILVTSSLEYKHSNLGTDSDKKMTVNSLYLVDSIGF
jgi:hypothetical protein